MASCQEDWQSTKNTLLERSRHMFNNPFLSDVVFTCEGSDKKLFAHKYVLATSSAVFYAMFYGKLAEKNLVVHLNDTNVGSLLEFLRFLYTDECKLTTSNAVFVLYLAKKYIVSSLAQKCTEFLGANIEVENVFTVLQQAIHWDEKSLENKCWDLIDLNTSAAVASDVFTDINQVTLVQFLKRETLKIREVDLFQAVLKWSEAECLRKGIEGNGKNKRNVLGNAIYEIRFASMTAREFAQNTSESGLLTQEEMGFFNETFSGKRSALEVWNMSERGVSQKDKSLLRCSRFGSYHKSMSLLNIFYGFRRSFNVIGVVFSKPVRIHGVRLLGHSNNEYDVTLEVLSQQVHKKCYAGEDSRCVPGFGVMLPAPVMVQADVPVHLKSTIAGPSTIVVHGLDGRETVNVNGITVHFFEVLNNDTNVKQDQFGEIIFSEC